jgi:Na+/proline symporter/signal transduction histidine kinase
MSNLHELDIAIVVLYLIVCLILGLMRIGKVTTLRQYAIGGRPFTTAALIATTFATAISAHKTIGNVGKSYELGIVFIATMFLIPVGWFIMSFLLAKNINFFHQKNFLTLGDIMEHWYGKLGRTLTSIGAIFLTLGILAGSSMAIGKLGYYFFNIPELTGMLVALSVVTAYSVFGGFRAVALTDVFQFFVFFIALPIACAIGYNDVGGYKSIVKALPTSHLKINFNNIWLFLGMAGYAISPNADIPFIQRALVSQNKSQLKKTFTATGILMFPLFIIIALIGLITYIKSPNLHTDTALFHFIKHYLPIGVAGLMISGVLAIIMSTQDSFLNSTSILISRDICKQIFPNLNKKKELLIARFSCIALSATSILLVFVKEDILSLIWFITNFWDPLVVAPFIIALIGIRIKKQLFFIIPLMTLIAQIITRQLVGAFDARSFTVGIITSIITTIAIYRIGKKQKIITFIEEIYHSLKQKKYTFDILETYKFSFLTIFGFFISIFFNPFSVVPVQNSIFYINAAGASLCLLLLLKDIWILDKRKQDKVLYLWYFILFFCLPFTAAFTLARSEYYFSWIINFVLVNTLLYLILRNFFAFSVLLITGTVTGITLATILNVYAPAFPSPPYTPLDTNFALYSCAFFLVRTMLVIHNRIYIEKHLYKLVEKKVADRTKVLRGALEVKREFLNNVSHEIKTPVHNITNIVSELHDQWKKISEKEKFNLIKILKKCNTKLLSLCSNLIDLSRLSEKNKVKIKRCDIRFLIEQSLTEYKTFENLISAKISSSVNKYIYCDQDSILQVLRNLLDNAIKYGEKSTIKIEVTNKNTQYVVFSVSDGGVGLPKKEVKSIFDPFEQSSRTKTRAGGTGLGLAICKKIIAYHNGKIWATNNKDKGVTFFFILPRHLKNE